MSFTVKENNAQQKPRVSVFIPSYNHAPYVERCLKSIIKQTYAPSELLVIDDGSKDNSAEIIERVLKDCPFPCEFIVRSNKGLCATLNEGLGKTNGDYFAYLGSDDIWMPEFLAARIELLESHPNAVLGLGHAYLIDEHDNIFDCSTNWLHAQYPDDDARPVLYCGIAPISPTVVYRRSALGKRGWNESAKLEDYELYLQLAHDGEFALDRRVLSAWRLHDYNTSRDARWHLDEILEAQSRVAEMLQWSDEKLCEVQTATRFCFSGFFASKGLKSEALSMLIKNLRGAPSLKSVIRTALMISVPESLLKFRRRKTQNQFREHHGVLQI